MIHAISQKVHSTLGSGFSERVYHNAFEVELRKRQVPYETERIVEIRYEDHVIGNLRSDIIVNSEIVLEFKTVAKLTEAHETQAKNYLRLTGLREAFVINFGRELECRRLLMTDTGTHTSSWP